MVYRVWCTKVLAYKRRTTSHLAAHGAAGKSTGRPVGRPDAAEPVRALCVRPGPVALRDRVIWPGLCGLAGHGRVGSACASCGAFCVCGG